MTPIVATFLWLADKFGKDAIESGVQLGWDAARWQRAARKYADKIECDYGRLPIFGKDRYVPIDEIYTYVHVLGQLDAFHQFAEEKLSELYVRRDLRYDPDKRQNGWPMVADGKDLFILGDPGAGRPPFSRWLPSRPHAASYVARTTRRHESPSSSPCANMRARTVRSTSRSSMS